MPRVIALNLKKKGFYGEIYFDFSVLDALQKIDLSENLLIGNIPSFFGTFRDLTVLNLAYNALSGVVPYSLACNKNLNLITTGNVGLIYNTCSPSSSGTSPGNGNSVSSTGSFQVPASSRRTKKSNLPLILGVTIPAVVLIWVAIGAYAMYRQRANAAAASSTEQGPTADIPTEERPMNATTNEMSP